MILSPGGGVVLREENRKQLKEHFFTIYLRARPETVVERLSKGENVLDGDGKSVEDCVEELRRVLQENGMLLP